MFNKQFIEVTTHQDKSAALISTDRILVVFPIPETEQLAQGKCVVMIEGGIRICCSESMKEVQDMIDPPRH